MAEFDLLASAAFGLEAIVVRELKELGYGDAVVDDGKIRFRGDFSAIARTNLWLRCADRIQIVVGDFPAKNFDDLFDTIKELPWEQWLPVDAKFPVTARLVRSEIRSLPNTQKMVKRAIVERLRKVYMRHWFEESGMEYNVDCNIVGSRAIVTIDTTGDGLHKRGYRNLVGQAPLRETLAAAMVKLSYWSRERLLVDPFCGSGTIPIEAAMIGRNLAPGRNRSFICENWEQFPKRTWSDALQEAKDLEIRTPLALPIVARDRDARAIKMAEQHARQAGVASDIYFEQKEFYAFPTDREAGILICNPPYGERLGGADEVRQLYADMGELLIPLDDWSLYILTAAEGFERHFGKTADRRRKLYNAKLACTFYQYLGPKPDLASQGTDNPEQDDLNEGDFAESAARETKSEEAPFYPMPVEVKPVASVPVVDENREDPVPEEPRPAPSEERVNPWSKARMFRQASASAEQQIPEKTEEKVEATPLSPDRPEVQLDVETPVDSPVESLVTPVVEPEEISAIVESPNEEGETTPVEPIVTPEEEAASQTASIPDEPIDEPVVNVVTRPWQAALAAKAAFESDAKKSAPHSDDVQTSTQEVVSVPEPIAETEVVAETQIISAQELVKDPEVVADEPQAVAEAEQVAKPEVIQDPEIVEALPQQVEPETKPVEPPSAVKHPWKRNPWQK
ncbi:THUMP domain-containing protein [Planctomicrobium sp. SH668]|uniref:THUMP domain-containing class I SAM-dependent RNA methyltransferase n=1 Tax=Planctomicrobium sp. SH668 TaxID=3448126 RepID=UPI003F5AFE84